MASQLGMHSQEEFKDKDLECISPLRSTKENTKLNLIPNMMSSLQGTTQMAHQMQLGGTGPHMQQPPLEPSFQDMNNGDEDLMMGDTGTMELGYTLTKRDELGMMGGMSQVESGRGQNQFGKKDPYSPVDEPE